MQNEALKKNKTQFKCSLFNYYMLLCFFNFYYGINQEKNISEN